MLRDLLAVVGALALVAAAGMALVGGDVLAGGALAGDDAEGLEEFPTETATPAPSTTGTATPTGTSGGGTTGTATPVAQPFALTVERIEDCGTTCRDVTVSLTNRQSEAASDVVVYTRVFAGNSTAETDLVWSGREDVGRLEAGGTYTTTERVTLSYGEAYAVEQADGWVTIQTTVETGDRTVTFTERRDVV